MTLDTLEFHPFANLFPMMGEDQHRALVANIKANGLLHPLIVYDNKLIDGRNRFKACGEAGVEPRFEELPSGVDPLAFVVGTNFSRRHLSDSQRAMSAARIEQHEVAREDAGKMFKVRISALKQAETVLKHGVSELIEAVEQDKIPVAIAAKLTAMPPDAQREACRMKMPDLRGLVKAQARIKKTAALEKATRKATEDLGHAVYNVLYADPPWKFEVYSANGMDRSAENHYPVMTTDAICQMEVPAAEDAILFLWTTGPMLPQALKVMAAWGFDYKSQFVWVKDKSGTGYWCRGRHELLLVGTRGDIPAPDPSERQDSVFNEPVGEHSEKPAVVREMIDDMFPTLRKIELFARTRHEGWEAHGNELPETELTADEAAAD